MLSWSKNPGMSSNDNGWELPCDYTFNIRNRIKNATDLKEFLFKNEKYGSNIRKKLFVTRNVESINNNRQETLRLIMQEIFIVQARVPKGIEACNKQVGLLL